MQCHIDWGRRYALMRNHALLHIVNTIALRAYGGLITGTLIGSGVSQIVLSFEPFDRSMLSELESEVNEVIAADLPISASTVTEAEFLARPDLIRPATSCLQSRKEKCGSWHRRPSNLDRTRDKRCATRIQNPYRLAGIPHKLPTRENRSWRT